MDKSLAVQVVDKLEDLYVENLALKAIIKANRRHLPQQSDIDSLLAEARKHPQIGGRAHEEFQALRNQFLADDDLEQALQAFLKLARPSGEVN